MTMRLLMRKPRFRWRPAVRLKCLSTLCAVAGPVRGDVGTRSSLTSVT